MLRSAVLLLIYVMACCGCTSTKPSAFSNVEDCVSSIFNDCLKKHAFYRR